MKRSSFLTWEQLKVGALILVALAVLGVSVYKLGQAANLFSRRHEVARDIDRLLSDLDVTVTDQLPRRLAARCESHSVHDVVKPALESGEKIVERLKKVNPNKLPKARPNGRPYAETRGSDPDGNYFDISEHGFQNVVPLGEKKEN